MDLSHIPAEQLRLVQTAGNRSYYHIDYYVQLTIHSGSIKVDLVFEGKRYGDCSVEYV
jgi:hypothetical protein